MKQLTLLLENNDIEIKRIDFKNGKIIYLLPFRQCPEEFEFSNYIKPNLSNQENISNISKALAMQITEDIENMYSHCKRTLQDLENIFL